VVLTPHVPDTAALPETDMLPEIDGYRLIERAGSGGAGSVYRAERTADGAVVAIKVLHDRSAESLAALRAEFAVLRTLQHPGLVAVHDLGSTADGAACLVMDWVDGRPVGPDDLRGDDGQISEARFASLLLDISSALGLIHARGVVHADVKPSNLLIESRPDGTRIVRLMDFGLAQGLRSDAATGLSGTPAYMAPELIRGEAPSPASDLYALGCTLYELVAGAPPFDGSGTLEVLRAHLRDEPETLDRRAQTGPGITQIVQTLMDKSVARRYRSCTQLFHDAARLLGSDRVPDFEQWQSQPPLPDVPRTREFTRALELCAQAPNGVQIIVFEGPDGIGKTRMLSAIQTELQLRGGAVQRITCREDGDSLEPLERLLRPVAARSDLDPALAAIAAAAFPALFPGVVPAADDGLDTWARELRLHHAITELLVRHGGARTWMIDDLHLAGESVQEFVHTFTAWLEANDVRDAIVVLATAHDGAAWTAGGSPRRDLIALAPFTPQQSTEALRRLLGEATSASFTAVLHRQSEGIPGRLEEMLAFCLAEGLIESTVHGWLVHEKENLGSHFPKSATAALVRAISRLAADELRVLRTAAAAAAPLPEAAVASAAGMAPSQVRACLVRIEEAGLVRREGASVLPLTPVVREALGAAGGDDAALHAALLAWYDAHVPDVPAAVRAHHLLHGPDAAAAAPLLLEAARDAARRFDLAGARRMLHDALAHARDAALRYDLLVELVDVANIVGARDLEEESIDELLVLAAASASPAKLGRVYRQQARFLIDTARFDRARKTSERALAAFAQDGDTLATAHCYRDMGVAEYRSQPGAGVVDLYDKARTLYHEVASSVDEGNVLVDIGLVYYSVLEDPPRALACFAEAREIFEHAGSVRGLARAHGNTGAQLFQLGRFEEALAEHERANTYARQIGDRRLIAISLGSMGQCKLALCRFSPALVHLEEELRIARELRDAWIEVTCLENMGELHFLLGDYEASIASYERTAALAATSDNRTGMVAADLDIAASLIARGETDAAQKRLASVRAGLEEIRDVNLEVMLQYRTGVLHLARGPLHDPAAALAAFSAQADLADRHDYATHRIIGRSYAAYCQALLGRAAEALDLSNAAMAMLAEAGGVRGGVWDLVYNHAVIQKANRLVQESADTIRHAYDELMRAAETIEEPRLVRSFLEQVRINADIVREYALAHRGDSKDALAAVKDQNLRVLYEVSRKINSTLELGPLLDVIMDAALEAMNAERGMMFLIEDDQLVLKVSRNVEKETIRDATEISLSILHDVIRRGHPIIVSDTAADAAFATRASVVNFHIHSLICVPMIARERLIGTVYVDSRSDALRAMSFGDIEAEFLEAFANLATMAIENARMHARLREENMYLRKEVERRFGFEQIVGTSAPMERLFAETTAAIGSDASVLIYGESGTGKELIARAIHYNGVRKSSHFVAVDCGAMPDTLLESELFGYKRGAFTGAYADKPGLFEEAHNGTLFLDEISNTSLAFQARLLRVLQEGEYRRVGDTATRVVNVRIICATNQHLAEEISAGRFRQDLFYRLNVIPITIPPLRDRTSDIPLLLDHFIEQYRSRNSCEVRGTSRELVDYLMTLPWRGNVRELENLVQRMLATSSGDLLTTHDLPADYIRDAAVASTDGSMPVLLKNPQRMSTMVDMERDHIRYVLQHTEGNKSEAAKILGLKRTTLIERMKKLGMM
jgi:transcriptional regulator with GAF, ATPase, and Fis domain/tetratricopeptide (TPR) repeat protein